MRKSVTSIMLACATLSLGGCHSLFGTHRLRAADVSLEGGTEVGSVGQLAAGRQALDAGNYAAAITAFSNIRTVPGFEGDAYNGMAIAFEGIGRGDLAETYFLRAVAVAPQNDRFRRNLARFMAEGPASAPDRALAVEQKPATVRISGLEVSEPLGRVAHVSANEVFIRSDPSVIMWEPSVRRSYPVRMAVAASPKRQASRVGWWGRSYAPRLGVGGRGFAMRAR